MLFNSFDFAFFFPVVIVIYFILPSKIRYIWLLVSSYFFYMNWNVKYVLILVLITLVSYVSARNIQTIRDRKDKKLGGVKVFILNAIVCLGVLAV